ncbi:hypothetical protein M670_00446 [Schinkia azotoformans MEV2011]|uniref:Uncharacterized protein n=1 Tax=Schinkia azotoformans MEV2011 TaxID=1348973 RepID=A0A072P4K8_SCHAZ|nr:hypothetical protein M670_00446 [Schinkia azotoformans MEV2011]
MDLHPLNDNNTKEAFEGLLKAVEKSIEEEKQKQQNNKKE